MDYMQYTKQTTREIKPTDENNSIIAEMLKLEIQRALNKNKCYAEELINGMVQDGIWFKGYIW